MNETAGILLAAAVPPRVRLWAKEKTASLDDVEFQRLYLALIKPWNGALTSPQAESHQRLLELVQERAQRRKQAGAT